MSFCAVVTVAKVGTFDRTTSMLPTFSFPRRDCVAAGVGVLSAPKISIGGGGVLGVEPIGKSGSWSQFSMYAFFVVIFSHSSLLLLGIFLCKVEGGDRNDDVREG